jgi:hypothetical protein
MICAVIRTTNGSMTNGRLPNAVRESRRWRIREIAPDFTLEDVWALPARGGAQDFQTLLDHVLAADPANSESIPSRVLWRVRDLIGRQFGLGRIVLPTDGSSRACASTLPIPGTDQTSLSERLPDDLRNTVAGLTFRSLPFVPLYRTEVEFAAELSNHTVHGVMHLAWVDQGRGRYQGQMAVYVKPRGRLGRGYMALIKPFRHWIVYPALMRQMERTWNTSGRDAALSRGPRRRAPRRGAGAAGR